LGEICLVRHGQASFGAADYDRLSDVGFEQSRRLGRWLAASGRQFDLAVSGSLLRHQQTAESCLLASGSHCQVTVDSGFNEYDHLDVLGHYDSRLDSDTAIAAKVHGSEDPRRAFQTMFAEAFARWASGRHDDEYRESFAGFRQRCVEALRQRILAVKQSDRVIVFTSAGPISVIVQSVLGLTDDKVGALGFSLGNAALTTLGFRANGLHLRTWNGLQHLEDSGPPRMVTYR
jgi:broad specificity phosphatase PhoE